jgi:hypothetical protein
MIVPPGTWFWEHRERHGIRTTSRGAPYVLESATFPERDMVEAFRFLGEHPRADLFLYEDASPAPHLPALGDFAPRRRATSAKSNAAPVRTFTLAEARALVGRLAPGARLVGGWQIEGFATSEGHPALRVVRGGHAVVVQIRPRTKEGPHFLQTRTADVVWLRDERAAATMGGDDEKVVRTVAAEIARVERHG